MLKPPGYTHIIRNAGGLRTELPPPSLSTLNVQLSITKHLANQGWFWLGVAEISCQDPVDQSIRCRLCLKMHYLQYSRRR